jgi:hypothetical protein
MFYPVITVESDRVTLVIDSRNSGQWAYRPGMERANEQCELDVARRFLNE